VYCCCVQVGLPVPLCLCLDTEHMKTTKYIYINSKNLEIKFVLKLRTTNKMNLSITRPSQTWHHQVHANNWGRLVDVEFILQFSLKESILLAFCCHLNFSKQMVQMGSLSGSEVVTIICSMKTKKNPDSGYPIILKKNSVSPHKM